MAPQRFKDLGHGSFFGDMVYLRVVPRDHFLVKLNQAIDWELLVPVLLPACAGLAAEGRPPYSPVVILKMLLITYLHNLSERQAEQVVNFQLPVKEFVGLAVDECAPDHSTLCLSRRRLREASHWDAFEAISDEVLRQAMAAGITLGKIQVVDSVHAVANVDNEADRRRQEQGEPPRDPQSHPRAQRSARGDRAGWTGRHEGNSVSRLQKPHQPECGNGADHERPPHLGSRGGQPPVPTPLGARRSDGRQRRHLCRRHGVR